MRVSEHPERRVPGPWLLGVVVLIGCGRDPILDRAESLDAPAGEAPARSAKPGPPSGSPQAGKTGAQAGKTGDRKPGATHRELGGPQPGVPAQPAPGDPAEPGPGRPDAPAPGVPEEPSPGAAHGGPSVQLSGRVTVEGDAEGTVRIDVFDGDQRAAAASGTPPKVVAQARLETAGDFSVAVPQGAGSVWIGGFVDQNGNGRPDRDEPAGWVAANPLSTAADHSGLELVLRVDPPPGSAP